MRRARAVAVALVAIAAGCAGELAQSPADEAGLPDGSGGGDAAISAPADAAADRVFDAALDLPAEGHAIGDAVLEAAEAAPDQVSTDVSLDTQGGCASFDEPTCKLYAASYACTTHYAKKVPGGTSEYVGCSDWCVGGATLSCALDPAGKCWLFNDHGCYPLGWTAVYDCNADAAPACSGAFENAAWN